MSPDDSALRLVSAGNPAEAGDHADTGDHAERFRWFAPGTHITIRGLTKTFGDTVLYEDFDLDLPRGKVVSIFGPNGCGKSTLINMISGIMDYDAGTILFDGKTARETKIGYVFQNYREAGFPWLRAIDNIRYPLKFLRLTKAEQDARIEKLLASFNVSIDLNRYPYELSGGQQQLVSIMRALVIDPEVLFLDEPFSALDYEMTLFLRDKLQAVLTEMQVTSLLVSHDLDEAVELADEVLLLTRKPTSVAARIPFDAPRPRNAETTVTPEFIDVKTRSLEIFQREVRKP
ncbi:ABC transporter ATP-binding protein [Tropicimonas sediminicola]|uniref:NitT/TauT family transport system ATP-binding protein n=1 Tax=Tropicimonas sediminicola TaxID=1031541 RepID=A0A239DIE2_9RHOB|nr:ABC transporter ATP-binding protein [Tropicimonas sediminicola]SNS31688.1 NitT/TauT family transport system ATP-binding protein [Tropicimonas sediminicola]